MPRDALYLRVSTDDQAAPERFSIPVQRNECTRVSESSGGEIVAEYLDDGASAFNDDVERRPQFKAMLEDAQRGLFDRVIVYSLDRFARDVALFHNCLRLLDLAGVELVSATQYYDRSTVDGELMQNIIVAFSHAESRRLGQRISDALSEKRQQGQWVGNPPFGYRLEGGRLVVDDEQAAGYRLAVRSVLEGVETYREIGRILHAAGYRTSAGGRWYGATISRMLRSPAYLGLVVIREEGRQAITLPGEHEPLIDRASWERLQRRCDEITGTSPGSHRGERVWPLSGILLCARCGRRMLGLAGSRYYRRYDYYMCGHRNRHGKDVCDLPLLRAEMVDDLVAQELDRLVLPGDWREAVLAGIDDDRTRDTLAAIEEEERRLTRLYQEGYIVEFEEFKTRWDELQHRKRDATPIEIQGVEALGELLEEGVGELWREAENNKARRKLARAVFEAIYVDGDAATEPRLEDVEWKAEARPLVSLLH